MTYTCRHCGKECPGFECSCQQRLERKHIWDPQLRETMRRNGELE